MYITISNVQNGDYIPLNPVIDNREGNYEVPLAEITYYNRWVNISHALGNNKFRYGGATYTVQDGYYSVCDIDKQYFEPLKLKLVLNPANGKVSVLGIKDKFLIGTLGEALGFRDDSPEAAPTGTGPVSITAPDLPNLAKHKELFVHLDEGLSTIDNRHNGAPSTLLRVINTGKEECNTGKTGEATLVKRHWKRLANGALSGIQISVRDLRHELISFVYLSYTLEVRHKKR